MTVKFLLCALSCALFACAVSPLVFAICKKARASQSILKYVDKHAAKNGTLTMGGMIFVFSLLFCCLFLLEQSTLAWTVVSVTLAYAVLGFLDDFIKIRGHNNQGLTPLQKIFGQVGIAVIVAVFLFVSKRTTLHFFGLSFDIGFWVIPLVILVMVATTNSVNLIDGLDGLCGGVSFVYILFFGIILAISNIFEMQNLAILCFGLCGAILAYLMINCYPAKIFMGDTGSLALGAFIATVACVSGLELFIPIMGILYVLTAVSDIIQVAYFKKTHKRVFLMAPLHHHFEQKGVHENRIVFVYIFVTVIVCLSVLMGVLTTGV